jgi:Protein kinase domain
MIPAADNQTLPDGESSSSLAARLELLLQHTITTDQFETDMVRACRGDPEEIWNLLALLDQHHRLGRLPTDLFRALKASANRYGLVRRQTYRPPPGDVPTPRPPEPPTVADAEPEAAQAPTPPPPEPMLPPAAAPMATTPPLPEPMLPPAAAPMATTPTPAASLSAPPLAPTAAPAPSAPPGIAAAPILGVGSVLGNRYRLEAELDSDDRGRNFQALDLQHAGQPAAVCQVGVHCARPQPAEFETALAERRVEFQTAQPLAHPNVLTVRELDQDGVWIYLTMNLMRGETLGALLARRHGEALARNAALAIIRDIGAALSYAHEHGVVHGDLQPQNVLISPTGELRVRGFGAQRASSCYASCEQLENRSSDRRDDLYSLACISYQLLHGSHPFNGLSAAAARGRGISPARPLRLTGKQWRALRVGLAWRREGRNLSIERWLARMEVARGAKRLPALENLMAMPAPRRSWVGIVLIVGGLAAIVAAAAVFFPSFSLGKSPWDWRALRTGVLAPAATGAPAITPTAAAPALQAAPPASPPAPAAAPPAAAPPVPATPEAASVAPAAAPALKPVPPKMSPTRPVAAAAVAATAPSGPARVELSADRYTVQSGDSAARILVRRSGASKGDAQFVWWTENATAVADLDFVSWGHRVERVPAGQSSTTLLVPIIQDATRNGARTFYVIIGETGDGAKVGGVTRAAVLLPGHG